MKTITIIFLLALTFECSSQIQEEGTFSQQVWMKTYNGPASGDDRPEAIAIDNNENVIVIGTCDILTSDEDYVTIKYNSSGDKLWERRYDYNNSKDEAYAVTTDKSGNIYVTGHSGSSIATIKYNSSGTIVWEKRYTAPGGGYHEGRSIVVDTNGNVFIAARTDHDCTTIKYSTFGVLQWVSRYYAPNSEHNEGTNIGVDASGNVYTSGNSYGENSWDFLTIKHNSAGEIQWVRRYDGPSHSMDILGGFAVDDIGNIYITGQSRGNATFDDYVTIKYSSDGRQLWLKKYAGPSTSTDEANSLAIDASGNVYVTGFSDGFETGGRDIATIKYNSAGVQQWLKHYNGEAGNTDQGTKIVVDISGNVYVIGSSAGANFDYDYVTIKYNSSGNEKWVRKYSGSRTDHPLAIAVDKKKNVYVTGFSTSPDLYKDIRTIKYSQNPYAIQNRVGIPNTFSLSQNYPNPFNPVTKISFSIPNNSYTKLTVYDISGKQVAELINSELDAGSYNIDFDASHLSSGTYFYRMESGSFAEVKKMVLVK